MKLLFFFVCISIQTFSQNQGKVRLDRLIADRDDSGKDLKMSTMIWYLGSNSIQEISTIDIKSDSTGTYTTTSISHYLFIDPNLQTYIYFKTFSDTALIIKYSRGAKVFDKYGGWDLYSTKMFDYDSYMKTTDTTLNGISYSRHRFRKIVDRKKTDYVIYTNCQTPNIPVKYLKPVGERIGCPVIRMETYFNSRLTGITELHYIADTLTDAEIKVFQTWGKSMKKYPVTK
jgi:hypothetical protein